MRHFYYFVFYIFLNICCLAGLHARSIPDSDRYYFSTYDELVKFFEQPSADGINFSPKPTEFYADVYQRTTLTEAVTACVFEDTDRGIRLYKSNIVTYVEPGSKKPYEVPAISFSTGSYHNNPESVQDKETSTHWKIIAPSGEMHDSAEYANSPSTFDLLWHQPNNLPGVPGIQCSGQVVQHPDGSNSFQISIGDQDVCMQAHTHFPKLE